jgi:uncharacterized protein YndB with AHSA1/START domain
MKFLYTLLIVLSSFTSTIVVAHGPTPQKIDKKVTISASVDEVWKVISDFGQIDKWHPSVTKVELIDEQTRTIHIKDKGTLTDSLDELNQQEHLLSYRLLEEDITVLPVSFYTITLTVNKSNLGSELFWQGRFYRADTGNFPSENLNDEAAVKSMSDFAESGIENLKILLETK